MANEQKTGKTKKQKVLDHEQSIKEENGFERQTEQSDESDKGNQRGQEETESEIIEGITDEVVRAELSPSEEDRLDELETIIKQGLQGFMLVGSALLEIQENKLYKASYSTFEEYMKGKFEIDRRRGYFLINAAKTTISITAQAEQDALLHNTIPTPAPQVESHANALSEINPEDQFNVWKETYQESKKTGKPITAGKIRQKAADSGVPLNKKPPKDRKAPKPKRVDDDEFGPEQAVITAGAMRPPGIEPKPFKPKSWSGEADHEVDTNEDLEDSFNDYSILETTQVNQELNQNAVSENDEEGHAPFSAENSFQNDLVTLIAKAIPTINFFERRVMINATFFIRNGLAEAWMKERGYEQLQDDFVESLTYEEAVQYGFV